MKLTTKQFKILKMMRAGAEIVKVQRGTGTTRARTVYRVVGNGEGMDIRWETLGALADRKLIEGFMIQPELREQWKLTDAGKNGIFNIKA